VLAQLATLAAVQHQPERAARLYGATAATSETTRTRPIPLAHALVREGLERARGELGDAAFSIAFAQGRTLSLEQAVGEALAVEATDASNPQ